MKYHLEGLTKKQINVLKQLGPHAQSLSHVLFGLAYFDDAESERMAKMLWNIKWAEIKKTILGWVKGLGK